MCDEITYPFSNFNSAAVEVWNGFVISSHTLLGMWLLIHARIKIFYVSQRGPSNVMYGVDLNVIVYKTKWQFFLDPNTDVFAVKNLLEYWFVMERKLFITLVLSISSSIYEQCIAKHRHTILILSWYIAVPNFADIPCFSFARTAVRLCFIFVKIMLQ